LSLFFLFPFFQWICQIWFSRLRCWLFVAKPIYVALKKPAQG
jgi:hypothetical protein